MPRLLSIEHRRQTERAGCMCADGAPAHGVTSPRALHDLDLRRRQPVETVDQLVDRCCQRSDVGGGLKPVNTGLPRLSGVLPYIVRVLQSAQWRGEVSKHVGAAGRKVVRTSYSLEPEYQELFKRIAERTRRSMTDELRMMLDARAEMLGLEPISPVDPKIFSAGS